MRIFQLALRDLWERPFRCILSIFGIALAVATFVSVEALIASFEHEVFENIASTDTQIEVIESGAVDFLSSIVPEHLGTTIRTVPGVQDATPMLLRLVPLNGSSTPVLGWPEGAYLWNSIKIDEGRRPRAAQPVEVVAGRQAARRLNLQIGTELNLLGSAAVVVGLADSPSQVNRAALFVRLRDLQDATFRKDQATSIAIRVAPEALPRIAAIKTAVAQQIGAFTVLDTADLTRNNALLRLVRALSAGLSVIAVILGLFGVLNTAWTLARERRHEFAILEAMGWPIRRIALFMFCEAACVGVSGWFLGVLAGYGGAQAISLLPAVAGYLNPRPQPVLLVASAIACLAVCAVGTLLPVWSILRRDLASVLRAP